jgi:hypothetical protein
MIRLADYCCQGGDKTIDQEQFSLSDLTIHREGNRELIFSPLGNCPKSPKLALVGITPGGQAEKFAQLLRRHSVTAAAKVAAFAGAQETIKDLLKAHGFLKVLRIDIPADINESDDILTTSLVKCCLKVDGSYKYAAPEISASKAASYCVSNRFIRDIERYNSIRHVVIFGDPGWDAITSIMHKGVPIKTYLESRQIKVLNMPHFAQNFQQRAIYVLDPSEDERYFQKKPKNRAYWAKAARMRQHTMDEVSRLTNEANAS